MPRDSNGNYSLVPGINPVIPGTTIDSDWANPTLNDIAAALTDSLSRSGSGSMTAPFRFADGSSPAPGISWTNEPTSGWYRNALNDFRYSVGGTDVLRLQLGGVTVPGTLTVTGAASFTVTPTFGGVPAATQNDAIAYAIALG